MESIGQILKAARERRQVSIADVAVATKMSSAFVKAIEADNFGALVAPVYARGFIKLYAACVGLDPMPLLKQFDVSSRAAPALAPLPSKVPTRKASVAYAEKLQPPHLQQNGPLPRHGAMGKPEQEKVDNRSKASGAPALTNAPALTTAAALANAAALATAAPIRVGAHAPIAKQPPARLASLLAGCWPALNRMLSARVQWLRFKLPGKVFPCLPLPVIVWRRIFILAFVVLLIIAASLAWEWSHRGLPSTTDACRWLAEPPAPYLAVEASTPVPAVRR